MFLKRLVCVVMAMMLVLGSSVSLCTAKKVVDVKTAVGPGGDICAAEGETVVIKVAKSTSAKVKLVKATGCKCTVKKNKITAVIRKRGSIKYTVNGKKKEITTYVGSVADSAWGKDSKVKKSEYKLAEKLKEGNKSFNDFFEYAAYTMKKNGWNRMWYTFDKKEVGKWKSSNRGIVLGYDVESDEFTKKYPSSEGIDLMDEWSPLVRVARYYDKKSGLCAVKCFLIGKKGVETVRWEVYKNKHEVDMTGI